MLRDSRTRPTSSRARQIVFDVLRPHLEGARMLDLCCGFGTIGAEALGRGCGFVAGVEILGEACRLAQENWMKVSNDPARFQVMKGDILARIKGMRNVSPFDIVYFDPPYESDLYEVALPEIPPLLSPGGILLVEHGKRKDVPENIGNLSLMKTYSCGDTRISVFREARSLAE